MLQRDHQVVDDFIKISVHAGIKGLTAHSRVIPRW
jgi:hypothetical protein